MKSLPVIVGGKPQRQKYLTFGSPDIGPGEVQEVVNVMRSGWLSTGKRVELFEEAACAYLDAPLAKALHSCTAAMHLALIASGIGPGDEVITTPLTFAATANVILHVGATPVFVDVDRHTGLIDVEKIKQSITNKTKAIIPVHLYGRPCEMDEITKLARKHRLVVVEDAAHAFGARYRGKKIGTIGDFTCFSFYVTKNLVTGEGGMLTMKRKTHAQKVEQYALHGMSHGAWKRYSDQGYRHYTIEVPGYKYNMMDLQAAIGLVQLKRFDAMQKRRSHLWERYMRELSDLPIELQPQVPSYMEHAHHLFTFLISPHVFSATRDKIMEALHRENIGTGIHFVSLHLHPYYRKRFGFRPNDFLNARYIGENTISIPLSSRMTEADQAHVITALKKICAYYYKPKPAIVRKSMRGNRARDGKGK